MKKFINKILVYAKLIIKVFLEQIDIIKGSTLNRDYYAVNIEEENKGKQYTLEADNGDIFVETVDNYNNRNVEFEGYKFISVDGGDLSGKRQPKVVVDIGFGDRKYYGFTNEYGQLIKVMAKKIILQDDFKEPVTSIGRYYRDEAKVPGVEKKDLDAGHVIADSLGGVANAYNITPQNSMVNRRGKQAEMEESIRRAGGCVDFIAIISYPNNNTQIPSYYSYTYTVYGKKINVDFSNSKKNKLRR